MINIPSAVIDAFWLVVAGGFSVTGWKLVAIGKQLKKNGDTLDRNTETLDKTHTQVANTHTTNLRDDLDGLSEQVKHLSKTVTDGFKRSDHQHGETLKQVNALQIAVENTRQNAHDDHAKIESRIDKNSERLNALENA